MISIRNFIMLVSVGVSAYTPIYATQLKIMPGISIEFNLVPQTRTEFTNISYQPMNVSCRMNTEDENGNDIFIEMLKKKGKINDLPVSTGDNVMIHVRSKEILLISAEPAGKVAVTNKGTHVVSAFCTTY